MPDIIPFNFQSHTVRTVVADDGEPWFVAMDVAAVLGYSDAYEMTKKLDEEDKANRQIAGLGAPAGGRGVVVINESGMYSCVLTSQKPEAKQFKRWVTSEVLPSIRRTGQYQAQPRQPSRTETMTIIAEAAARMLRMSEPSKVRMLSIIAKEEGVPATFLPSYVEEPLVRSLTYLLKEHGAPLSVRVAYPKLESLGLVERLNRLSSKGQVKHFWSLTDAGLKFGNNLVSPNNPRETQPQFYVKTFAELLGKLL